MPNDIVPRASAGAVVPRVDSAVASYRAAMNGPVSTPAASEFARGLSEVDARLAESLYLKFCALHVPDAQRTTAVAVEWYRENLAHLEQLAHERDAYDRQVATEVLRVEWGRDFEQNLNHARGEINRLTADDRAALESARTPDGRAVLNMPGIATYLAQVGRERSMADVGAPGARAASTPRERRIGEIEARMRTNRRAYDRDVAMQREYRDLLDARGSGNG